MAVSTHKPTRFAPAERATSEDLTRQIDLFRHRPEYHTVLDFVSDLMLVLNRNRQVVYANSQLKDHLELANVNEAYGQRLGELLNCVHANNQTGGCGTSEACSKCQAMLTTLESLEGQKTSGECSILTKAYESSLDLHILGTPLSLAGDRFSVLAIKDISHAARRAALEHTFFHDIMNTAGGLLGFTEMMNEVEPAEFERLEIPQTIQRLARQLIDEISAQRLILQAEKDMIVLDISDLDPADILTEIHNLYRHHQVAEDRHLLLKKRPPAPAVQADRVLLNRVLGNMTKNALEACQPEQTVTLDWTDDPRRITFSVHNPNFIPRAVQFQLFKRTFSTRGSGRGLGTYSMKLFGEKFLGGEIWFETDEHTGTTFYFRMPLKAN